MSLHKTNLLISKAILQFQEKELEATVEAVAAGKSSYSIPRPDKEGMPSKYKVPSPKEMMKKGMPGKSRLIKQGEARKGLLIGNWVVVDASRNSVTVTLARSGGKRLTHKWDGFGYVRQGGYLYTDGIHVPKNAETPDYMDVYPEGSIITAGRYNFVIISKPIKKRSYSDKFAGYVYKARKPKGKKVFEITIEDGGYLSVWDGKKSDTLHRAQIRSGSVVEATATGKSSYDVPKPTKKGMPAKKRGRKPGKKKEKLGSWKKLKGTKREVWEIKGKYLKGRVWKEQSGQWAFTLVAKEDDWKSPQSIPVLGTVDTLNNAQHEVEILAPKYLDFLLQLAKKDE